MDIQSCKKYNRMRNQFLTDKNTNFVYSTGTEKTGLKKISQARIQHSSALKAPVYSRLPYTYGDFLEIWNFKNVFFQKKSKYFCDFCTRPLLMYLFCGGFYKTHYHVRSICPNL